MEKGPDALDTAENECAENNKPGPDAPVPSKTSLEAQNKKIVRKDLGTAENESGSTRHENGTRRPGTAENESGSTKQENGTRRLRYRRKRVQECITGKRDPTPSVPPKMSPGMQNTKTVLGVQSMKTGPEATGSAENESGSAKQ
jgi:hypothetical protein